MDPVSQAVTILGAVPSGLVVHSALKGLRPQARLVKWNQRVEHIATVVSEKGYISPEELKSFSQLLSQYHEAKAAYKKKLEERSFALLRPDVYGSGNEFATSAREAWEAGIGLSTEGSERRGICRALHYNVERNDEGECTECVRTLRLRPKFNATSSELESATPSTVSGTTSEPHVSDRTNLASNEQRLPEGRPPPSYEQSTHSSVSTSARDSSRSDSETHDDDANSVCDTCSVADLDSLSDNEVACLYRIHRIGQSGLASVPPHPGENNPWTSRASDLGFFRRLGITSRGPL
ncbi:hypothetical protein GALMADRAFT_270920 [Galerina marginata CBS 339.88]|uniref:Uncharacterized protein n=1 Tax=Galerina marginata (strain CBS 339.88) TaxID=685588 RepID=A0A067SLK1_GALM3|nr:hypothetical protein GALMADRAFT_270920 [Galerina marginata CBS 339.88]